MEKLLQLCDMFSCSLDTLLRKDASAVEVEDSKQHREHMKEFRKWITCGSTIFSISIFKSSAVSSVGLTHSFIKAIHFSASMSSPVCNTGRGWYSMMKNGS